MATRAMAPEDLYLLRSTGDPQLSPDGSRVAWVETVMDGETDRPASSIWVAPSDGSGPARQFSPGPRDGGPRWSPDGRWLAYLSAGEDAPPQLHLAPLDGGVPGKVTDLPAGVSQPSWSPDGTAVAFVSPVGAPPPARDRSPTERSAPRVVRGLFARQDNIGWFEGRRHVFVLEVATGQVRQVTDGDWDDDMPAWSPDGDSIVFSSDRDRRRDDRFMRSDAWVVPSRGRGRPRRLTRGRGRAAFPRFSPDGTRVAFVGGEDGDEFWDRDVKLMVVSVDGGEVSPIGSDLDRPTGFSLLPTAPFAWVGDDTVVALAADRGRISAFRLDAGGRRPSVALVDPDGQVEGFSLSADGRRMAYSFVSVTEPSEIFVASVAGGGRRANPSAAAPLRLSAANDEFRSTVRLGQMERRQLVVADGTTVEYFLVYPPGRRGRGLPVHLEIHGGPHGFHPIGAGLAHVQALAASGCAVLLPNPRGSASYGQDFTSGCVGDWGGGDYDDLMACVDDVVSRGIADPERLTVGGYSYGGFMTTWVVGHTSRFRAAVVGAPVIDQLSMLGTCDIPGFVVNAMGGLPWDRADEYQKRSPLTYLPNATTPVLIQHWDGDLRCPIGQGEELYTALKLLDKTVELVRYPGGSHISRSPSQAVDRTRRIIAWRERWGAGQRR
ncbi:MAG TPA: S9 family peptidase [Acidimicrobiales bacterium]|nr:S9 family peptidase [Acidimicrobiales bacterium]